MENVTEVKAWVTAVIATLTALWGWFGWLALAWGGCMLIDYFTGCAAAVRCGEWESGKAKDGCWHKTGCIISVIVAMILDACLRIIINQVLQGQMPFEYSVFFGPMAVTWYFLMEVGSIIENVGRLGAPVPPFLRKGIKVLKATLEQKAEEMVPDDEEEDQ